MTAVADHVRSVVARIETLQAQIDDLNADKADIYKEAKGTHLDVKALKEVVRIRRNGETKWEKSQEVIGLYLENMATPQSGTKNATRAAAQETIVKRPIAPTGTVIATRAGAQEPVEPSPLAVVVEPKPVIAAPPAAAPAFRGWPRSVPTAVPPRKPDGAPYDDLEIPAALRRTDAQVSP